MLPFIMKGRNESAVYHRVTYDISKTRKWLRDYNRASPPQPATMFHLYLWACAQALHEHPTMNRFVSGGRTYQREQVSIAFAAKATFAPEAPLKTVKCEFPRNEPFAAAVERITSSITDGRKGPARAIDKELALASWVPVLLLRLIMWLLALLDRVNLLPRSLIDSDPMFASLFVANLGSVGLDDSYHHLYEYGSIGIFAVMGTQKKTVFIGRDGAPVVRDGMLLNYTLDERIADGYQSAVAMKYAQKLVEDPERYIGAPEQAARAVPALTAAVTPPATATVGAERAA